MLKVAFPAVFIPAKLNCAVPLVTLGPTPTLTTVLLAMAATAPLRPEVLPTPGLDLSLSRFTVPLSEIAGRPFWLARSTMVPPVMLKAPAPKLLFKPPE